MPPKPARDISLILFDLKVNSRTSALHALSEVILYHQLSQSKNECKLYFVNAAESSTKYDGILNVDAATNISSLIEEILATESGKSSWLEALHVAVEELKAWFETAGVVTLRILFVTDMCSFQTPNDEKLLKKVISDVTRMDIFLYVIGPPIDPPKTIFSDKDVKDWMVNFQVDETNADLKLMKIIVKETPHSVMCNYDVGMYLFHSFKYRKGGQPWKVPLGFGSLFKMPVSTIRLTKREPPFKLKKMTAANIGGADKWAYEDQQDVTVEFPDVVRGIIKHEKFVKIETDGRFKIEGPRCFQALGFTAAKNVPEYLLQSDGSYLVIPEQDESEEYIHFFNTFVEELANRNVYILAKRVYNKDFNPKFVALIPRTDFILRGFVLCQLPYADDIAHVYIEQDLGSAPKADIDKDVWNYLNDIDVTNDTCRIKVPLAPTMMNCCNAMGIISKAEEKLIEEKYLEKKFNTSDISLPLNLDNLKNEWPVRQIEKIKKKESALTDFDDIDGFTFS